MRDWSVWDPGYSENDATHPRNRPAGAGPADPVRVSAAVKAATGRVLAAGVAAQLATGVRQDASRRTAAADRRAGTAAADLPAGHKEAALAMYNRVRDQRKVGSMLHPVDELRAEFDQFAARSGRVCMYW